MASCSCGNIKSNTPEWVVLKRIIQHLCAIKDNGSYDDCLCDDFNAQTPRWMLYSALDAVLAEMVDAGGLGGGTVAGALEVPGLWDNDTDTGFQAVESGAAGGGDRLNIYVDGSVVGYVEILASGTTKWTLDGIVDPIVFQLTPITTAQRDALTASEGMIIRNSTTSQLEEYDGAAWNALGGGGTQSPSAADAISPAADDDTGAVGTGTDYAREDHKHPAQSVSTDSEQLLKDGSDGLAMLAPDDMISAAPLDNMLIKGTDGKLNASLDAATIGVPGSGNYVLGWTDGTLTIFPI